MKVAFLSPTFPRVPSGGSSVIYRYANGLVERGHDVTVVHSLNRRGGSARAIDSLVDAARGIRDGTVRHRVRWMNVDARVRLRLVDRFDASAIPRADVLIPTFWATVQPALDHAGHARVIHLVQAYEDFAASSDEIDRVWRQPICKVVVSKALVTKAAELGIPRDSVAHIPNAVDHDVFYPQNDPTSRAERVAMMFHRWPVKGAAEGLEALRLVHHKRPDVRFTVFGTPRAKRELPRWIDYLHRPRQSTLAADVYNRATVFLCPSRSEGWGLPAAEAMACGAAVVSTRNGGVEDFAVHEDSALLCPPGDSTAMAAEILRLVDDSDLRRRLVAGGGASVRRFDWAASTASFERYVVKATSS